MIKPLKIAEQDILKEIRVIDNGCEKRVDFNGWCSYTSSQSNLRLCASCIMRKKEVNAKLTQLRADNKIFEEQIGRMNEILEDERKATWEDDEKHSSNPIHQSDFIAMQEKINKLFGEEQDG
jgi:hypothetical protein